MGRGNREKFDEETVIRALKKSRGIKSKAAQILQCSRRTVTNYIERHPEVKKVWIDERETLVDVAEDKLVRKVDSGFWPAVQFMLKTLGKDRGYTERSELTGAEGDPLAVDVFFANALEKVYGKGSTGADPEADLE